ncbi:uncharacterized protein L199_004766 [Kwoniella botswanensis]|uniref:uncharacterized protein n=1 Tax=Kwoniella botswanensis TaxID=1268659 RepID=UPI00315D4C46
MSLRSSIGKLPSYLNFKRFRTSRFTSSTDSDRDTSINPPNPRHPNADKRTDTDTSAVSIFDTTQSQETNMNEVISAGHKGDRQSSHKQKDRESIIDEAKSFLIDTLTTQIVDSAIGDTICQSTNFDEMTSGARQHAFMGLSENFRNPLNKSVDPMIDSIVDLAENWDETLDLKRVLTAATFRPEVHLVQTTARKRLYALEYGTEYEEAESMFEKITRRTNGSFGDCCLLQEAVEELLEEGMEAYPRVDKHGLGLYDDESKVA